MSKFIDRLKDMGRAAPQPIGFGQATAVSRKPRIFLVASIEQLNREILAEQVAGADAALLSFTRLPEGYALDDLSKIMGDIPWGIFLNYGDVAKIDEFSKSGCDFVVFAPDKTPLSLTQYKSLGRIVELSTSLPDGLLRTVGQIPADAALLSRDGNQSAFTWRDLMLFRHFANLLAKPFIVPVSRDIADKELLTLWEAGVDGVVVPAGGSGRTVKELRAEIDKLSFFRERGAGRRDVVLPSIGGRVVREEVEEEEEEEEDE